MQKTFYYCDLCKKESEEPYEAPFYFYLAQFAESSTRNETKKSFIEKIKSVFKKYVVSEEERPFSIYSTLSYIKLKVNSSLCPECSTKLIETINNFYESRWKEMP